MPEINEPRAGYVKHLYDVEMDLYFEALEKYVGEWYAIHNGKLYHSPEADEIERQLRADGIGFNQTHVSIVSRPRPYRHFHY